MLINPCARIRPNSFIYFILDEALFFFFLWQVMHPNETIAVDKTIDIQDLKDNCRAPQIVQKLLNPSVPPSSSNRFVIILCDSIVWELLGIVRIFASDPNTNGTQAPVAPHTSYSSSQLQPTIKLNASHSSILSVSASNPAVLITPRCYPVFDHYFFLFIL